VGLAAALAPSEKLRGSLHSTEEDGLDWRERRRRSLTDGDDRYSHARGLKDKPEREVFRRARGGPGSVTPPSPAAAASGPAAPTAAAPRREAARRGSTQSHAALVARLAARRASMQQMGEASSSSSAPPPLQHGESSQDGSRASIRV